MVGETGADGRYALCTSLPHFMFGRSGKVFMASLGNVGLVSPAPVTRILQTKILFYLVVSSDPIHGRIRTRTGLG